MVLVANKCDLETEVPMAVSNSFKGLRPRFNSRYRNADNYPVLPFPYSFGKHRNRPLPRSTSCSVVDIFFLHRQSSSPTLFISLPSSIITGKLRILLLSTSFNTRFHCIPPLSTSFSSG